MRFTPSEGAVAPNFPPGGGRSTVRPSRRIFRLQSWTADESSPSEPSPGHQVPFGRDVRHNWRGMTVAQMKIPEAQIGELCRRQSIKKLALFGSVLTGVFTDSSDRCVTESPLPPCYVILESSELPDRGMRDSDLYLISPLAANAIE